MKQVYRELGIAALMGFVLPMAVLLISTSFSGKKEIPVPTGTKPAPQLRQDRVSVPVLSDGVREELPLEDYLVRVVLAEMPASFEEQALKAQAVVARTYTLKTCREGKKHDGAICTDYACCQAYITEEAYLQKGGRQEGIEKIRRAVRDTAGEVLTYGGGLIEATYFSCSGGRTEDAAEVWGTEVPYLKSTDSPGEEAAAHFSDTVRFEAGRFLSLLELRIQAEPETWLGEVTYTEGGGVRTMVIGGKEFTGTELRRRLDLRSTAFQMEYRDGAIMVTTRGFGHRVGMSQYGAEAMAEAGSDYRGILAHYYAGTVLNDWEEME